jgi:hypothetical protein
LLNKGDIAPGYDADVALVDPDERFEVRVQKTVHERSGGINHRLTTAQNAVESRLRK